MREVYETGDDSIFAGGRTVHTIIGAMCIIKCDFVDWPGAY